MKSVKKLNILITGASRGIGKALTIRFTSGGANLLLLARNEEHLKELSQFLGAKGVKAYYKKCDVSIKSDVESAVDYALETLGSIDLAILNSGIGELSRFKNPDSSVFKRIFDVNFFGVLYFLEYLIPVMLNNGGTIAAVSSIAGIRGMPGSAAYSTSKAALNKVLEAARAELSDTGINIVTIRPGFVYTDMTAKNKFIMPFIMKVEKAADIIYKGIMNGKKRIYFPKIMAFLGYLGYFIPDWLWDLLAPKLMRDVIDK